MKRLMLILAIGVSFTSISFAAETGQMERRSEIPAESIDCAAGLRAKAVDTQPTTTLKSQSDKEAVGAAAI